MTLLEQAQAAGVYRLPSAEPYLRYSHAFRDLRPRPEFQQLLNEVASQTPKRDGSEDNATQLRFEVR
jgi:hypothetical protein